MNRNLDGTPLTVADLRNIADANGLGAKADALGALHNTGLIRSGLMALTRDARFAMFMAGALVLDTRTDRNTTGRGTH